MNDLIRSFFKSTDKCEIEQTKFRRPSVSCNPYNEIQVIQNDNIAKVLQKVDEERFAVAIGNVVYIYSYTAGEVLYNLRGHHRKHITSMMVIVPAAGNHARKNLLLTASADRIVCIWNLDRGRCSFVFTDQNCAIRCFTMLESENVLVAAGQHIGLWSENFAFLCLHQRLNKRGEIYHIAVVNRYYLICAFDSFIEVYIFTKGYGLQGMRSIQLFMNLPSCHKDTIKVLKSFGENNSLFAAGSVDGIISIWNSQTFSMIHKINLRKMFHRTENISLYSVQHFVAFEKILAVAIGNSIVILHSSTGKICFYFQHDNQSRITQVAVPDGKHVLTCSEDGKLKIWGLLKRDVIEVNPSLNFFSRLFPIKTACDNILDGKSLKKQGLQLYSVCECCGHGGAIQMFTCYEDSGIVSCGADQLTIIWKHGLSESAKRIARLKELFDHSADLTRDSASFFI